jgi:hypothetical protein
MPTPLARFGIGSTQTTNQIYLAGGVDGAGNDQTAILEYTVATNGAIAGPAGTPSGVWTTRGNLASARRGLQFSTPPPVTNFLPGASGSRDLDQDAIAAFVAFGIRSARAPVPLTDPAALRGRLLFREVGLVVAGLSCASCHGGPKWTRSAVTFTPPPSAELGIGTGNERVIGVELRQTKTQPNGATGVLTNVGTFNQTGRANEIRSNPADAGQTIVPLGSAGLNIPSLLSVHETAPYFYSGLAQTLDQVLDGSQDGNGGTRVHFVTDSQQRADLVRFLQSIDPTTPTFP